MSPYQNIVPFGGEAQYFPGVRDDEAVTVHLHNPKPWQADVAAAPCGLAFHSRWGHDLQTALEQSP